MKFFRNLSIKNKLIVIVLSVSILAIVTGFTIVAIQDIHIFKEDLVNATTMSTAVVGEFCAVGLSLGYDKQVEEELGMLLKPMPIIENGYIYDEKNDLFARYNKSGLDFEPIFIDREKFTLFAGEFLYNFEPIFYKGKKVGSIYLRSSTALLSRKINKYLLTMVMVMLGMIVLSYFLALELQRVISKPILKLAGVTEDISQQADYSIRIQKKGDDEIGKLYDGFNNMLEQIQLREKERDEAEAERERLFGELEEKNKELEQVVYVTSHDLRSPLVNIQGFSRELEYSLQELSALPGIDSIPAGLKKKFSLILEEDIPDSLKYIKTSASKMDSLLAGLLKLSRVGRAEVTFSQVDMNHLMQEALHALEFQVKELAATVKVENLPPCFGDEMQINQAFSNLINNALKYLDPQRPGMIRISGEKQNDYVVYCVEDNGIGIAEEHQQRIFEIFHRLNPDDSSGEGLGLTIVNKIVRRHSGKVWVESFPAKGSKFFVRLPTLG